MSYIYIAKQVRSGTVNTRTHDEPIVPLVVRIETTDEPIVPLVVRIETTGSESVGYGSRVKQQLQNSHHVRT